MKRLLVSACALGLLVGCDTYPDIADYDGNNPQPSSTSNDTLFDADEMFESTPVIDTLDTNDVQDHFKFELSPASYNGPVTITLTGVSGDADIELFDFNLNLISWSRTQGTSDESISFWHDAAYNDDSYDVGLYFLRVYSADKQFADYTLSYDFKKGNAE